MNIPTAEPTLEERLRGAIRLRHYSRQTEETYTQWYKRYVLFQKGDKDRVVTLPKSLRQPIAEHLGRVKATYEEDRRNGVPGVQLPHAMAESLALKIPGCLSSIWTILTSENELVDARQSFALHERSVLESQPTGGAAGG